MKKLLFLLYILVSTLIVAQEKPAFWKDIENFKTLNKENPPPKNAILFVGSSSFTMWKDVGDYFPDKTIINRGFGGSSLFDLNFYSDELLKPYQPKQIVIYCGENDFAGNEKLKPRQVFNRYKHFYAEIRKYYPNIPVDYVSIKLSPSREHLWPKFVATNALIKKFMDKEPNAEYIDITKAMNDSNGKIRKDLFLEDMLHMKPEGYQLWKKEMEPYLK
ncbi:GDSL-type esterase/lipase family protein [uncultured Chryseobacterium sp.]|uniref:GDSL-type esterase/lipase family protein n=1 Tax=uncultured Chryseobacterium sp. TaxID=259322 RepID=UPI00263343A2|nr:GDSL-type esterase/lipase family protein [uncultured Chryseobacterium sp.]